MLGGQSSPSHEPDVSGDYTMDHTSILVDLLKMHFGWHLARIKCLAYLMVALFKVKTVNLSELATAFPGTADIDSHYKRLQRFLKQVDMQSPVVAQFVAAFLPYEAYTLSLDRTNWMFGCFSINFLVLSIVHEGIAFPIFWTFLRKKGNSNTQERIKLIDKFIAVFGAEKIACLAGDREFIGQDWFAYLSKHHIIFRIRIKVDMNISRTDGVLAPARNFFRSLPLGSYCLLGGPRLICGHRLWVIGGRLPSGEYLIIVANDAPDTIMDDYKKRWKIEVLFQALKSRGFNFEDTHITHEERLQRLFAVLTLAFCWAYHVGAWRQVVKPMPIKKHQRPARSIFRYGFDWIRHLLFNPDEKGEELTHVLTLLWNALTGPKYHIYQLSSL
jgi:hypothetical protein